MACSRVGYFHDYYCNLQKTDAVTMNFTCAAAYKDKHPDVLISRSQGEELSAK